MGPAVRNFYSYLFIFLNILLGVYSDIRALMGHLRVFLTHFRRHMVDFWSILVRKWTDFHAVIRRPQTEIHPFVPRTELVDLST